MRRLLTILLLLALCPQLAVFGQEGTKQDYRSDVLGLTFQYPADLTLHEQLPTQTVILASKADMDAVASGKAPAGLIFSITMSSFRQIGADSVDSFGPILKTIAQAPDVKPAAVRIAGTDGLTLDLADTNQDIASRTLILSVGKRRVAVIRGISTIKAWKDSGESLFTDLVDSLSFFAPPGNEDAIGRVLWQLPAESGADFADVAANGDGTALFVTDHKRGIWQVSANGVSGDVMKPMELTTFGGIGVLRSNIQYIADAGSNTIWMIDPENPVPVALIGGKTGTGRGAFGPQSPKSFAFGATGAFYVPDENENGLRIQVFDRAGHFITLWDLSGVQSTPIDSPLISTDNDGNVYVIGKNTPGIIKLNGAGKVLSTDLGKTVLANAGALAFVIDRFDSFYVATADQGILKLAPDGTLIGVLGEPYDESAPPKPGQLGKPVGMTLAAGGQILYVVDSGKYPQIVAFGLNGNGALNVTAGTRSVGTLVYGPSVNGEITATTFIDSYTFEGHADDVITITMQADKDSKIDPFVELLSAKGNRLAANDDAKSPDLGPNDAQIKSFRLPFNATYTVLATRFGRETTSTTGSYKLTLTLEKGAKH